MFVREFDDANAGSGRIEVRDNGLNANVIIVLNGVEYNLLEIVRDQWGVFYNLIELTICQEDFTKSFISAMVDVLREVQDKFEVKEN